MGHVSYWLCEVVADAKAQQEALENITRFLEDVALHLELRPRQGVIVASFSDTTDSRLMEDTVSDLRCAGYVLFRAPTCCIPLVTMEEILQALGDTNASVSASVIEVASDQVWLTDAASAAVITRAVTGDRLRRGFAAPLAETRDLDMAPQAQEFTVVLVSNAIKDPPSNAPPKWSDFFKNQLRTAKHAADHNFTGRVELILNGGALELTAHFKDLDGATTFSNMLIRSSKMWQCQVKEPTQTMIRFEWNAGNPAVQSRKIDTLEDIMAGVAQGNATAVGWRIGGDVSVLSGPTQAGKSTTISGIAGRQVVVSTGKNDLKVVEGVNPLVRNADELQLLYSIVRSNTGAQFLGRELVAERRNQPLLAGVAIPNEYEIVPLQHVKTVLETGLATLVPDEDWHTIPDVLAVAKDQVGCSTTTDIYAYDVHGAAFQMVLDTPGTHDTRGLLVDVRNTVMRRKALRQCSSIRLAIVVDFQQVSTAGGQTLGEFLAPVACMLKDYEKSLTDCAVLFTRVVPAMQLVEGTPESYKADLIAWIKSAIAQITGLVDSNDSPVMKDQYASTLLKYAVNELRLTLASVVEGSGPWGKATVVHPLMPAEAYLKQVISAAKALPPDAFRASLGPKGSAGLGRCLDLHLRQFAHLLRHNDERGAVVLAAGMYRAIMNLEKAEVHFTDAAKLEVVENEMTTLLRDRRDVHVRSLRAAVQASDVKETEIALQRLEASDANIASVLDDSIDVRDRMQQRLQIGPCRLAATQVAIQIANEQLGRSVSAKEAVTAIDAASMERLRNAVDHLLVLQCVARVCHDGGRAVLDSLREQIVDAFRRECSIAATFCVSNATVAPMRRTLATLYAVAQVLLTTPTFAQNVSEILMLRNKAVQHAFSGLTEMRDRIAASFTFGDAVRCGLSGAAPRVISEDLDMLDDVAHDEELSRYFTEALDDWDGSLRDRLFGPISTAISALERHAQGFGELSESQIVDADYLLCGSLPQMQVILERLVAASNACNEEVQIVVASMRTAVEGHFKNCYGSYLLDAQMTVKYNREVASSTAKVDSSTSGAQVREHAPFTWDDPPQEHGDHQHHSPKSRKILGALIVWTVMAHQLHSAQPAEEWWRQMESRVCRVWLTITLNIAKLFAAARQTHQNNRSLTGFVEVAALMRYARTFVVDDVFFSRCDPSSNASLASIKAAHANFVGKLQLIEHDFEVEVTTYLRGMTVVDHVHTVPYAEIAMWLRQLREVSPLVRPLDFPVPNTVDDVAKASRHHLVTVVKERHATLTRHLETARRCHRFAAVVDLLLTEGLKMDDSGVLFECFDVAKDFDYNFTSPCRALEHDVDALCHWCRTHRSSKSVEALRGIVNRLRTSTQQYASRREHLADLQDKLTTTLAQVSDAIKATSDRFVSEVEAGHHLRASELEKCLDSLDDESQLEALQLLDHQLSETINRMKQQLRKILHDQHHVVQELIESHKWARVIVKTLHKHKPDAYSPKQSDEAFARFVASAVGVARSHVEQRDLSLALSTISGLSVVSASFDDEEWQEALQEVPKFFLATFSDMCGECAAALHSAKTKVERTIARETAQHLIDDSAHFVAVPGAHSIREKLHVVVRCVTAEWEREEAVTTAGTTVSASLQHALYSAGGGDLKQLHANVASALMRWQSLIASTPWPAMATKATTTWMTAARTKIVGGTLSSAAITALHQLLTVRIAFEFTRHYVDDSAFCQLCDELEQCAGAACDSIIAAVRRVPTNFTPPSDVGASQFELHVVPLLSSLKALQDGVSGSGLVESATTVDAEADACLRCVALSLRKGIQTARQILLFDVPPPSDDEAFEAFLQRWRGASTWVRFVSRHLPECAQTLPSDMAFSGLLRQLGDEAFEVAADTARLPWQREILRALGTSANRDDGAASHPVVAAMNHRLGHMEAMLAKLAENAEAASSRTTPSPPRPNRLAMVATKLMRGALKVVPPSPEGAPAEPSSDRPPCVQEGWLEHFVVTRHFLDAVLGRWTRGYYRLSDFEQGSGRVLEHAEGPDTRAPIVATYRLDRTSHLRVIEEPTEADHDRAGEAPDASFVIKFVQDGREHSLLLKAVGTSKLQWCAALSTPRHD